MEVHPQDIKELFETTDAVEANEKLKDGWVLYDVQRGISTYKLLLVRV